MAQGFGGPRIPGMGLNNPRGSAFQTSIDVMSLDNAQCTKCGNITFTSIANIKMISPVQSPNGQWAHGVAQWWACVQCGYKFDPNEWVKKRMEELKDAQKADDAKPAGGSIIVEP